MCGEGKERAPQRFLGTVPQRLRVGHMDKSRQKLGAEAKGLQGTKQGATPTKHVLCAEGAEEKLGPQEIFAQLIKGAGPEGGRGGGGYGDAPNFGGAEFFSGTHSRVAKIQQNDVAVSVEGYQVVIGDKSNMIRCGRLVTTMCFVMPYKACGCNHASFCPCLMCNASATPPYSTPQTLEPRAIGGSPKG